MTTPIRSRALALATGALLVSAAAAQSQPLGTFRWQLQPYCNVVTVTVVQQGGQYQIDGTDDQCGAAQKASVSGLAFPNPDGSIGFGLATVMAPAGTPLHTNATIDLQTLSGTWRDSAGHNGAFVYTPGASIGGSLRPAPVPTQGPPGPAGAAGPAGPAGSAGTPGPPGPALAYGSAIVGSGPADTLTVTNGGNSTGGGLRGITFSNQLRVAGVLGENKGSVGLTVGVLGQATDSPIGTGVNGIGAITGAYFEAGGAPSGGYLPTGVVAVAPHPSGIGVNAVAPAIGVRAEATGATGVAVRAISLGPSGLALQTEGHAQQLRTSGGIVKALATISVSGSLAVTRCFNPYATNATTAPCGFVVASVGFTTITIDFGFQIDDRFVMVTPIAPSLGQAATVSLSGQVATIQVPPNATALNIAVF